MRLRAQRLVGFIGLCAVFGSAVWMSELSNARIQNPHALLAAGPASVGVGNIPKALESTPKNVADDTANKSCPDANSRFYDFKLKTGACPLIATLYSSQQTPQVATALVAAGCPPKTNAYGITCYYKQATLVVQGKCVDPRTCRGARYIDEKGKLCTLSESGGGSCVAGGATGQKAYSDTQKIIDQLEGGTTPNDSPVILIADKRFNEAWDLSAKANIPAVPPGYTPVDLSGPSAPGSPTQSTPPAGIGSEQPPAPSVSAGTEIGRIAEGKPSMGYSSNYTSGAGSNNTFGSGPSFFPSSALSDFTGLSGSGYTPPFRGSIAYVAPIGGTAYLPTGPIPVTNTSFDALNSQVTFGSPLQTPYGSISQLGRNSRLTPEERAVLALVEKFDNQNARSKAGRDGSVLRNSLADSTAGFVENVQDVISGVSDFFLSMFVPPREQELSEEEKAAEEARKALRFFLEPQDNLLAAGDPEALPTEIPDDELQPPGQGRGPSSTGFSSGDVVTDSTSGAIGTIANSQGQTSGGGASASGETPETAQAPSGSGASAEEDSSEPQGVVAKVKKAVTSLVSAVTNAIKSGLLRILSWF